MIHQPLKTLVSWSSGKDSAYALWTLQLDQDVEVVGLLTTVNSAVGRASMHGVRRSVLEAQARACRLPLFTVPLPDPCSDDDYRTAMQAAVNDARGRGVEAIAFGDLFLSDVRAYREEQLAGSGVAPLFSLWKRPTAELAREMVHGGLRAVITCVDTEQVGRNLLGRSFDHRLLDELPVGVDPCAENGEFHTVATAGPMFRAPLPVGIGEVVDRERFVFVDVYLRETAYQGGEE